MIGNDLENDKLLGRNPDIKQTEDKFHGNSVPLIFDYAEPAGELSLVDLAAIVVKHRTVLYVVFLGILLLGGLLLLLTPAKYKHAVVIEAGTYALPDEKGNLGERRPIEEVDHTKSKLITSFIPSVLLEWRIENKDRKIPEFSVSVPKGSDLVEIFSTAAEDDGSIMIGLLEKISSKVIEDHRKQSKDIVEQVRQNVAAIEINSQHLNAKLTEKKKEKELMHLKLSSLVVEKELLAKQIDRINTDLKNYQTQKSAFIGSSDKANEALSLLLIENELTRLYQVRDGLENKLILDVQLREAEIEKSIDRQNAQIIAYKLEADRASEMLNRFKESLLAIGGGRGLNLYPTRLSVQPYTSGQAQGLSLSVKALLILAIAIFLSIFATFIYEFKLKVAKRMDSV